MKTFSKISEDLQEVKRTAIQCLLLGLCSVSIFWAPWSVSWLEHRAAIYHHYKDYEQAKRLYLRILEKDPLLGLNHTKVPGAVMQADQFVNGTGGRPRLEGRVLAEDDRAGVQAIYGP